MGSVAGIISAVTTSAVARGKSMVVANGLAFATQGAETGLGFMQHEQDAQAASLRGRFENDVAERNAKLAEMQREDALNRGSLEENRLRGETTQQTASSRAALAAQGVDVSSGSGAAVTASEQLVGEVDALTIRNNAAREAWGYDVEAANQRMNGRLALLSGENEAAQQRTEGVSTLLSGASSLYGLYNGTRTSTKIGTGASSGRVAAPVVNKVVRNGSTRRY